MSGGRRIRCSRRKDSARCGTRGVGGDVLRERNLLETTERGFLSSFFECQVMFEVEDSNLTLKFVVSEEDIIFLCAVCTNV